MLVKVILTVIGSDRPGLTGALADAVLAAGGNWLESHLAQLAGKYVGSVLVELPEAAVPALRTAVAAVDAAGLTVAVVAAGARVVAAGAGVPPGAPLRLSVMGQDRPGIVREVGTALAAIGVNIESLASRVDDGAEQGGRLFRADAALRLPAGIDRDAVQSALEAISGEIMVDLAPPATTAGTKGA